MALIGLLGVDRLGEEPLFCRGPILSYGRKIVDATSFGPSIRGFLEKVRLFLWLAPRPGRALSRFAQTEPMDGAGECQFLEAKSESIRPWGLVSLVAGATASLDVQHGLR